MSTEKLQEFYSVREYEPLNKYCCYSLLDTSQLIQGQGHSWCNSASIVAPAKNQTVH